MGIRVVEGQRNLMYAPHYVAMAGGHYSAEGLDVRLQNQAVTDGPEAVAEGRAEVTVGGPMMLMRVAEERGYRLRSYATLLQRHPFFLVGRVAIPDFSWGALVGRSVIDFGEASTPWLGLCHALLRAGRSPDEVHRIGGLTSDAAVAEFVAGRGDFLLHSLHTAERLHQTGEGVLVASLAPEVGVVPFTSFAVADEFAATRRGEVDALRRGFASALSQFHNELSDGRVDHLTQILAAYLPEIPGAAVESALLRYRDLEVWPRDPDVSRTAHEYYRGLLIGVGWLRGEVLTKDVLLDGHEDAHADREA